MLRGIVAVVEIQRRVVAQCIDHAAHHRLERERVGEIPHLAALAHARQRQLLGQRARVLALPDDAHRQHVALVVAVFQLHIQLQQAHRLIARQRCAPRNAHALERLVLAENQRRADNHAGRISPSSVARCGSSAALSSVSLRSTSVR